MTLFISSEVMFFVGFFWAFFNFAMFPEHMQGNGNRPDVAAAGHPHVRSVPCAVPEHDDPAAVGRAP
jgi:heme/copper-type cytochrome/quinol oxidase subunit 3